MARGRKSSEARFSPTEPRENALKDTPPRAKFWRETARAVRSDCFGGTSPRSVTPVWLCGRYFLHRNELIAQLFRVTPDFIF